MADISEQTKRDEQAQAAQPLISENLQASGSLSHKYERRYPVDPPANLSDIFLFTKGQPWEAFAQMQREAPVCWHETYFGDKQLPGWWAVTRYADIMEVSRNTEVFSSQRGGIHIAEPQPEAVIHPVLSAASYDNMICMDGDWHAAMRKSHHEYFTPSYTEKLRAKVGQRVDELLEEMAPKGEVDFVSAISAELPIFTLSELLGMSKEDGAKLGVWTHYLEMAAYLAVVGEEGAGEVGPNFFAEFMANVQEMFEYGREAMKGRRADREEDLMTAIAWSELERSLLRWEYLDGSWLLIVFAGNDTTRNSISGTLKLLTENPEQKKLVLDDPSLVPGMCDEALRMVSPVMHMRRTAQRDYELNGQMIAEGEKVVMWYGAANRDPEVFADPNRFDIRRENASRHIAFGYGRHICLGLRTARMQLEETFTRLLKRFPDIEWNGEIEIAPNNFVHGIRKLGASFTPQKG